MLCYIVLYLGALHCSAVHVPFSHVCVCVIYIYIYIITVYTKILIIGGKCKNVLDP